MESQPLSHLIGKQHKMSQYQFKVEEPCHENWDAMKAKEKGRFCASCSKDVVDFTSMSDIEVKNYFLNYKGSICGRFKKEQLEPKIDYYRILSPYTKMFVRAFATVFILLMGSQLQAQVKPGPIRMGKVRCVETAGAKVSGNVVDEHAEPVSQASISFSQSGNLIAELKTAANGSFYTKSLSAGVYDMVIKKVGFADYRKQITIGQKPNQIFSDLKMKTKIDQPEIMGMMIMGTPRLEE